ncbi:MAG TPA: BREX system ATP-binding protein BrxD [Treponemataceae bacterium]|mgnify:FL=1|nr:BREX system ATP-binding protein BrxD [Treponemataceae bacterium]
MKNTEHIFERLRSGTVPERGLDKFAVGIDKPIGEIRRQLDLASSQEGCFKFLRGGYGCGKTFMAQYTLLEALQNNFAVSFVVVSPNDTQFHKFDDVYNKIVSNLKTSMAESGALEFMIDRWISKVEDRLAEEIGDNVPDFDEKVKSRFDSELDELTRESTGIEFINVIKAYFDAKQAGEYTLASSLAAWLSGSKNISASVKSKAGIKGEISSSSALIFLRGIVSIVKRSGYKGLVVVIDELETILRTRSDVRQKSLNGLRQIIDAAKDFPGMLWVFTGTPEFFDTRKGVAGLEPLHDRIKFTNTGGFTTTKQPQLELKPFDKNRLMEVALRLRDIFPTRDRDRLYRLVDESFLNRLTDLVSSGLRGDVGVIPRQFLRELVNIFDLIEENDGSDGGKAYIPMDEYRFPMTDLSAEDQELAHGNESSVSSNTEETDGYNVEQLEW